MQLQADGENPVQELTSVLAAEYLFALVCHTSGYKWRHFICPRLPLKWIQVEALYLPSFATQVDTSGGTLFALVCHTSGYKWRHFIKCFKFIVGTSIRSRG